ncbi:hypothetical protein Cadr_000023952 [Camelus dromedarius]|uniref:Uncharacterized protein n=1 Tax=Camelus dromedarius TaxID=9838 RepID=A0A5N4CVT8_CAMDR|nr:hypothetical protein Cadr_000023952 [Camelus dromedarius]
MAGARRAHRRKAILMEMERKASTPDARNGLCCRCWGGEEELEYEGPDTPCWDVMQGRRLLLTEEEMQKMDGVGARLEAGTPERGAGGAPPEVEAVDQRRCCPGGRVHTTWAAWQLSFMVKEGLEVTLFPKGRGRVMDHPFSHLHELRPQGLSWCRKSGCSLVIGTWAGVGSQARQAARHLCSEGLPFARLCQASLQMTPALMELFPLYQAQGWDSSAKGEPSELKLERGLTIRGLEIPTQDGEVACSALLSLPKAGEWARLEAERPGGWWHGLSYCGDSAHQNALLTPTSCSRGPIGETSQASHSPPLALERVTPPPLEPTCPRRQLNLLPRASFSCPHRSFPRRTEGPGPAHSCHSGPWGKARPLTRIGVEALPLDQVGPGVELISWWLLSPRVSQPCYFESNISGRLATPEMVSGLTLLACACCSHLCIWYPQPLQFIPSGPTHQGPEQRHSDGQLYMEQDSCSPGHKPHCPSSSSDSLWSCPAWLLILGKHHCVASSREAQAEAELGMGTSMQLPLPALGSPHTQPRRCGSWGPGTALFTVAKTWKQPKCPSTDDWMKKSKVAPEEDGTADADDEVDVQKGFHQRGFFQGHYDRVRPARGPLLALAVHSTEPQDGFHHFGPLLAAAEVGLGPVLSDSLLSGALPARRLSWATFRHSTSIGYHCPPEASVTNLSSGHRVKKDQTLGTCFLEPSRTGCWCCRPLTQRSCWWHLFLLDQGVMASKPGQATDLGAEVTCEMRSGLETVIPSSHHLPTQSSDFTSKSAPSSPSHSTL